MKILNFTYWQKITESNEYYKRIVPISINTIPFDKKVAINLQNLFFDITKDFFYNDYQVSFNTDDVGIDIYMTDDEWFVVLIFYFSDSNSEFKGQQHYYMCDQYEGLIKFINDEVGLGHLHRNS